MRKLLGIMFLAVPLIGLFVLCFVELGWFVVVVFAGALAFALSIVIGVSLLD